MAAIKGIISDADGTLVNTLYLIRHGQYEAAVEYLASIGVSREHIPDYEIYEDYLNKSVGGPTHDTLQGTLRRLYADHPDVDLSKIDFESLNESLTPIQDRLAPLYVHPFHGLTNFLEWMGKGGLSLGIFTSGSAHHIVRNFGVSIPALGYSELYKDSASTIEQLEAFAQRSQAIFGLPSLSVVTCDDVSAFKPDPEGILTLLDRLGLQRDEVIVLGDHSYDMEAAQRAGITAIGISHGFGTPAELKAAGAAQVVGHLFDVADLIDAHNSGQKQLGKS